MEILGHGSMTTTMHIDREVSQAAMRGADGDGLSGEKAGVVRPCCYIVATLAPFEPDLSVKPECPGWDLNPYAVSGTRPSNVRVYLFRHLGQRRGLV
jgi:hypothetical protein